MKHHVTHFFAGLALQVRIGFHEHEKAAAQRVLIDLEYDVDEPASAVDGLDGRVDYDTVRHEVERIALSRHFNLQETLCREILAHLLARPQISRARVATRKPDAYPNVDAVGVIVEARKPTSERNS